MSTIKVTNIQDTGGGNSSTSAEIYSGRAKAWVNFNGSGTVAIRAQFNVSSITDNGTGDYTINFANALADADYTYAGGDNSWGIIQLYVTKTASQCRQLCISGGGAAGDRTIVCLNYFR